jgi:hypothetical protein
MHIRYLYKILVFGLLLQCLFFLKPLSASPSVGLYFSQLLATQNGFLILGLEIAPSAKGLTFLAQELRYHPSRGWEEILYSGTANESNPSLVLKPNSCQIRASAQFGEKKGLLRRYDCEHLTFTLAMQGESHELSTSLVGSFQPIALPVYIPGLSGEPVALSLLLPGEAPREEGIWGFHLNGIGKSNPIQKWSQKGKSWEKFQAFEIPKEQADFNIYRWRRTFSD